MTKRGAALWMMVLLLASYVLNSIDRNIFTLVTKEVQAALQLSLPEVGLTSTLFTLGMGLAALPTGKLLDRLSRKTVVILGLFIFSLATFLTAFSSSVVDLAVYRVLSGVGEAIQVTALIAIGVTYFVTRRALITGLVSFAYGIGAVIAPILTAVLLKANGWQMPFLAFGVTGIVFIVLIALSIKPWFSELQERRDNTSVTHRPHGPLYRAQTILNPVTLLLAVTSVFTGMMVYGFFGLFPLYIRTALAFSPNDAAFVLTLMGIGGFSAPLGGWIGDRVGYQNVLFAAITVTGISAALSFTPLGNSVLWHAVFAFLYGASVVGFIYANLSAIIISSVTDDRAGVGTGLFVSSYYIPAAFSGLLVGVLKDHWNWTGAGVTVSLVCAAIALLALLLAMRLQRIKGAALGTRPDQGAILSATKI